MTTNPKTPEMLDLSSMDMAEANRAKLKALFPSVFTETYNEKGELAIAQKQVSHFVLKMR
jgi:hypothetical protein